MGVKKCSKCDKPRMPNYSQCRECHVKKCGSWHKQNPESRWTRGLKQAYGISEIEYNHTYIQQGGRCAICKQVETKKYRGAPTKLAVDHCHKSGTFRGLLCLQCNTRLSVLEHDWYFNNALRYLFERGYELKILRKEEDK